MRRRISGLVLLGALLCAFSGFAQESTIGGIRTSALRCFPVYGPRPHVPPAPSIPRQRMGNFKIGVWGMNTFKIRNAGAYAAPNDWRGSRRPRGWEADEYLSESDLQRIKRQIETESPDTLLMTEIRDLASIRMFATHSQYLNGAYSVYVHSTNQMGTNIAFLVKKGLPLQIDFETHIHAHRVDKFGESRRIFTRDVPTLILRAEGSDQVVILIGVHAKSARKVDDGDIQSDEIHYHEMDGIRRIEADYRHRFPNAKIGILGDINVDVQNNWAVEVIKTQMESFLDLVGIPKGDPRRATQVSFVREYGVLKRLLSQMDDFLMDGGLFTYFLSGRVLPFTDENGKPVEDPRNWEERDMLPTDHKMIEVIFDFFSLFYGKTN